MAAGKWQLYTQVKNTMLTNGDANRDFDKAVKIELVTTGYTPSFSHTNLGTGAITGAQISNVTGGDTKTVSAGNTALTATGNNYRFDITATGVQWQASTAGTMSLGYAIMAFATDDDLIGYCDLDTSTTGSVDVTAGNTFTMTFPTSGVFLLSGATSAT